MAYFFIILVPLLHMLKAHQSPPSIQYLPLGDSYTIGEGVHAAQSWPSLLTENLRKQGMAIELLGNPAVTGYTTDDLIREELPELEKKKPNFVTLLIGVNDYVQGRTEKEFKVRFVTILDFIQKRLPDKSKLLLITIPDFSVTPNGKHYAHGRNAHKDIALFNQIIKSEAKKRKLPVVDIFHSSLNMGKDPSLVCEDGLHPSAKEYVHWEKMIRAEVEKMWR